MSIIQISKILVRSGNLVDLPQLSEAEIGFASDVNQMFIGGVSTENVEVLTAYSNISFSQISGSSGNISISTPTEGQVLAYSADNLDWTNRGGSGSGVINLGNVGNLQISGGAVGYVLETDGTGNLSWASKGTLYTNIADISIATSAVMTITTTTAGTYTTPYTNGASITITGVDGTVGTIVNGLTSYVQLATDYPSTGNLFLFSDSSLSTPIDTTGLTYTTATGVVTSLLSSGSGGAAGGSSNMVQFNNSGVLDGSANLTFDNSSKIFTVTGNTITSELAVTGKSDLNALGNITITGGSSGQVISTNGLGSLTWATPGLSGVSNGTSSVSIPVINSSIASAVNGANVLVVSSAGIEVTGSTKTSTITTGANTTAGTITGSWTLSTGSTLQSGYADLAEYYSADKQYEPGTVVEFGGDHEITIAGDGSSRVAGVVSTDPAYVMNSHCAGEYPVAIALQGRVLVKVRGSIRKGDMLISGGGGYARPSNSPNMGTVLGKSLENFDGIGIIEVAVSRI
jgi:hypothetical protein